MAEKPKSTGTGIRITECVSLMDKAFDGLISRSMKEEAFSADLTESVVPVLNALKTVKGTYISHLQEQIKLSGPVALGALDEHVNISGAINMLKAAIAVGKPLGEGAATKSLLLGTGEVVKPWLHIIKEIIELIINHLPIPIPRWLKDTILELLDIIDKIFGGKKHD
ncbi:MAG TPA: hypothetical protein VIK14_03445 [Ignavibacteria bacterium]